jgi:hypothetical protein
MYLRTLSASACPFFPLAPLTEASPTCVDTYIVFAVIGEWCMAYREYDEYDE